MVLSKVLPTFQEIDTLIPYHFSRDGEILATYSMRLCGFDNKAREAQSLEGNCKTCIINQKKAVLDVKT